MTWTTERFHELTAAYAAPEEALDSKGKKARRILAAATDRFLHFGYRKASIDDIARAAGVGKGTVYLYFETKADLLMHCILFEKAAPSLAFLEKLQAIEEPAEQLRLMLRATFDLIHDMPLIARLSDGDHELTLVMDELGVEVKEVVRAGQVAYFKQLLAPIAQVDEATLDRATRAMISVLRGAASIVRELDDLEIGREEHSEMLGDMLTEGMLAIIGAGR